MEKPEETSPPAPMLSIEVGDRASFPAPPMAAIDAERVKRIAAFFKYTRTYWGMGPDGSRGEPLEWGGGDLDHMDRTVIDGVNIGEVYRELKQKAVKRIQEEPVEDAPSADELAAQWGDIGDE